NNTAMPARVAPDSTSAFETGSLVLTGAGPEYYYVIDESGRELNYSSFNRPLSLFPSDYTVKLGNTLRKATVKPGASTSLEAFHYQPRFFPPVFKNPCCMKYPLTG